MINGQELSSLILVIVCVGKVVIITATPILTPATVDVIENKSVVLTCNTSPMERSSFWQMNEDPAQWAFIILLDNGTCTASGFIEVNNTMYMGNCSGNGTFTLTLLKPDETQHNRTWRCRQGFSNASNNVTVYVKVPVKLVDITTPSGNVLMLKENQFYSFTCQTSYSRPTPSVKWFLQSETTEQINATSSDILTPNKNNFISAKNVLNFSFGREQNGGKLYCNGSNGIGVTVSSRKIILNITFPTDGPPIIVGARNGSRYQTIEHEVARLSCSVSGGNPLARIVWFCLNGNISETTESNTAKSSIEWKALRNQQNTPCVCSENHMFGNRNTSVTIDILYPPSTPTFKIHNINVIGTITRIQNNSLTVTCSSSSNPESDYVWIKTSKTKIYNQKLHVASVQDKDSGQYTCAVNNTMIGSNGVKHFGSSNSSVEVQVLFPPHRPTFRYSDSITNVPITSQSFDVIKGDQFTIYCLSEANPNPEYRWEDGSHGNESIMSAFESINKTCTASNIMKETVGQNKSGSASTTVAVSVLYPPEIPTIRSHNSSGNTPEELKVIETDPLNLVCESVGRPSPYYIWYVNGTNVTENHTYMKKSINRRDSGTYTCKVLNTMARTFGMSSNGSNKRSIEIDILYPAEVGHLGNITVIEGKYINITCPVIKGNPVPTRVQWSSAGSHVDSNTAVLYKSNVSRDDEGTYNCSVTTTMIPTYRPQMEKVNYGYFYLSVVYRSHVKEFHIINQTNNSDVTVNEKEDVKFVCYIESKPFSTAYIFLNGKQIFSSHNNFFEHIIGNIKCNDSGTYTCSGMNDYNSGVPSTKDLFLNVNCSPRPSPNVELKANVTSARRAPATLSFTAIAYPAPGKSGYIWNYIKGSERVFLSNSTNVEIFSSSFQSNLTIKNVTEENYGSYVLEIKNTIDVYEQWFNLYPNELKHTFEPIEAGPGNTTGLIAGVVSAVVVVVVVVIVVSVYLFRKRNVKETGKSIYQNVPFSGNDMETKMIPHKSDVDETCLVSLQEVDDAPVITSEPTEYYNSLDKIAKIDRLKVSELFSYVLGEDIDSFGVEYQKLPTGLTNPCTFARKPENLPLNRYNGIYPYDHSRVQMNDNPDFFINACYIDGYKRANAYIASLGPTANTTNHFKTFWEMIWHEKSDIIVMLTNLREPSGMKCERYWPESPDYEWYGDVCVSCQKTEVYAEYTVRTLTVIKDEERRTITHLHYTAWPDKKVPEDTTSLLEFRKRIKSTSSSLEGPIVIHCSAGIGRTGTLIAIDRLITEGQCEDSVNVFACVNSMREQRVKMVQTLEQYVYIYKSLVNALSFDCGTIDAESIQEYMDTTNNNIYSRQFQQLKQSVEEDTKEEKAARFENEKQTQKNRQCADIPTNHVRILLFLNRGGSDSDYINAVYLNSFRKKDYFIVAQSPLQSTVEDFICMIYQENCTCIVTMEDFKDPGMDVGIYLPADKHTLTFGNFKVSCTRLETKHSCVIRKVKIVYSGKYDSGEKTFYHFQYNKWYAGQDTPVNSKSFVQFVNEVDEYADQFDKEMSHMLVHCLKANERSALFCAVQILTEKLKYERQVNVANTIRHMRARRHTAITSMEQLKFCYQAACDYVQMFQP